MSEQKPSIKPSKGHLLTAAIVVMLFVVVVVFVLSKREPQTTENAKFKQDVVIDQQPTEAINTAKPALKEIDDMAKQVENQNSIEALNDVKVDANSIENINNKGSGNPNKAAPLPSLDDSDEPVKESVANFLAKKSFELFITEDMIRRSVVFIENLSKGKVAKKHIPLINPIDSYMVFEDDIVTTDPNSYERYTPYVTIFSNMSTKQMLSLYNEYQPLIAQAYEEIGFEGDTFNDTLLDALEVLIKTPVPKENLPLIKESVTYKYAYPEWERLNDAQKQFLRMGPQNMKIMKRRLAQLEKALQ